jgi:arylsulfatase A-like enzyme
LNRPNILYIHSHDTGRYVQPYGHAVSTPNIQRLAEEGVLFRRAFAAAPTCSPSRAALVTGQSPHSCGMLGLASNFGFGLNDYGQHVVQILKRAAGYHSALAGVEHVVGQDRSREENAGVVGYDETLCLGEVRRSLLHQQSEERLEEIEKSAARFLESSPPEPFFLDVGFLETHRHGIPELERRGDFSEGGKHGDPRYSAPPTPLPDAPETREDMADFNFCVERLDRKVGTVVGALERSGLSDRTLVICTTDHGIPFPGMKSSLTDHGIGVMLIVRGPGGFSGGRVSDALVSQVDLLPTVCDLAAMETPSEVQGRSLLPLVNGEREEIRSEIFAEITHHLSYEPQRAIRTLRWKYIKRFDGRSTPNPDNYDPSPSKDLWLEHGWAELEIGEEQLYDLVLDPNEARNLADYPRYQDVLEEMRDRLVAWMKRTDDPLLRGPVPDTPEGASARRPWE